MFKLKLRKVGNSLGVTLPAAAVRQLQVREGDALYLTNSSEGFRVTAHDPDFELQMQVAERVMSRYRNALRTLSK